MSCNRTCLVGVCTCGKRRGHKTVKRGKRGPVSIDRMPVQAPAVRLMLDAPKPVSAAEVFDGRGRLIHPSDARHALAIQIRQEGRR